MGNCLSNSDTNSLKTNTKQINKPSKQQFIENLKKGCYQKITFLVGAGISVSSGIPDFRTPDTGLYSQLKSLNINQPEDVFNLDFFKVNPKPFYIVSKGIINEDVQPTISHLFMKELQNRNKLQLVCSQNIDGLELKAGIKPENLIQAHGHYRDAHCIDCQQQNCIQKFKECVLNDTIQLCTKCKGYVKPDIVFFKESLPYYFDQAYSKIQKSDLVIIMGTSLKVYPFARLLELIQPTTTIVLINRENSTKQHLSFNRVIFFEGDIDENVNKLFTQLGWQNPNIAIKKPQINNYGKIK